jgi:hypothetical protein
MRRDSPTTFDNLSKALRGEAQEGSDMVDMRAWLVSIVVALGFGLFLFTALSLLIG